jgi:hypothetical protein
MCVFLRQEAFLVVVGPIAARERQLKPDLPGRDGERRAEMARGEAIRYVREGGAISKKGGRFKSHTQVSLIFDFFYF